MASALPSTTEEGTKEDSEELGNWRRSNERSQDENVHRRTKLIEPVLEYLPVSVPVVPIAHSRFFPVPGPHWFTPVLRDPLTPPLL